MRTLAEELRYVLGAAERGLPTDQELEAHILRGPGRRTLVARACAQYLAGPVDPTKIEIAASAVSEIQIRTDAGFGGHTLTLFANGTLAEIGEVVALRPQPEKLGFDDRAVGVATINGTPVEIEVLHHAGTLGLVELSFARVQGKYAPPTPPQHLVSLARELEAVLELASRLPFTMRIVHEWIEPRAVAITTEPPGWATDEWGHGGRYAELAGSTVAGMQYFNNYGGGCDVVLHVVYGAFDEVEQVVGTLERQPRNCDSTSGLAPWGTRLVRGAFEVRLVVEVIEKRVARVRVQFPGQSRLEREAPPPPPPRAHYVPSRLDVAVLAIHDLGTRQIVHHELDRRFTIGSSPECDLVVSWHNPWSPDESVLARFVLEAGHLRLLECSGLCQLDGYEVDLNVQSHLGVGSQLIVPGQFEIVVTHLPETL